MEPLAVQLWGLFPTYYNMCRGGHSPWSAFAGQGFLDRIQEEQVRAYPQEILGNMHKAAALAELVALEFGPRVRVTVVAADSLTGVALSLKHRLRGDLNVVVAGQGRGLSLTRDLGDLRREFEVVRDRILASLPPPDP